MFNRHKRSKKIALPRIPKVSPVKYADELSRSLGLESATSLAQDLAKGGENALGGVDGRSIMFDYTTVEAVRRHTGFWKTVAGYLRKKLEASTSGRARLS